MSPTPWSLPDFIRSRIAVDLDSGCWLWTGSTSDGYAQMTIKGRTEKMHRYIYEACAFGIPDGLQIDHLCRVRRCVNPSHLEPVTRSENIQRSWDMAPRAFPPEYPCGHPRSDANTYLWRGLRKCLDCCRSRRRSRYYARKSAA